MKDEVANNSDDDVVDDDIDNIDNNIRHHRLRSNPIFWSSIGVIQTLLCAGIVFGWASLLPVLRDQNNSSNSSNLTNDDNNSEGNDFFTPQEYAQIFTLGAVGNYLSTLFFGAILDNYGPRLTGITASLLFALGLLLSMNSDNYNYLSIGFGLLGFSGPGIQLPTLHLANLFNTGNDNEANSKKEEGGGASSSSSGGSAVYMSAQAAAFDGGTAIFAILRLLYQTYNIPSSSFLLAYLIVPLWVLLTSIFIWPDDILDKLDDDEDYEEEDNNNNDVLSIDTPTSQIHHHAAEEKEFVGIGSPYLSPSARLSIRSINNGGSTATSLVNERLSIILYHPAFYSLAIWTSIHILKLNFVVATINDQLVDVDEGTRSKLMDIFGAMLPFGFVALPIVAQTLSRSAFAGLQLANIVGVLYGAILLLFPTNFWCLTLGVFPFVATSRQLVYSTVFSQIGEVFGFRNYGILLGITNICVSAFSTIQNPLINWSESVDTYYPSNLILLVCTFPLFGIVYFADPAFTSCSNYTQQITRYFCCCCCSGSSRSSPAAGENMPLLLKEQRKKNMEEDPTSDVNLKGIQRPKGIREGRVRGSSDGAIVV